LPIWKLNGNWPTSAQRRAPREINVRPDPAGIDDVDIEDGALALERCIVLEPQHGVARAPAEPSLVRRFQAAGSTLLP
jgi:hypothetical protein